MCCHKKRNAARFASAQAEAGGSSDVPQTQTTGRCNRSAFWGRNRSMNSTKQAIPSADSKQQLPVDSKTDLDAGIVFVEKADIIPPPSYDASAKH
jgi:hypothetical protein